MDIISNLPKKLHLASETTDGAMSKEHVTDIITLKSDLNLHTKNNSIHITSAERTGWNGKAPSNHASSSITYGGGTSEVFGHVKLSDIYNSSVGTAGNSIGASQESVFQIYEKLTRLYKLQNADLIGWQRCSNSSGSWSDLGGTTYFTYIPNIIAGHKYLIKFSDGVICEGLANIRSTGQGLIEKAEWYTKKQKTASKNEISTAAGGTGFTSTGGGYTVSNIPGIAIICMSTINSNLVTYYYDLANILLDF